MSMVPAPSSGPDRSPIISVLLGVVTVPSVFCLVGYLTGLAGVLYGMDGLRTASKRGRRIPQGVALLGMVLNSVPMAGCALYLARVSVSNIAAGEQVGEVHEAVRELDAAIDDHDDARIQRLIERADQTLLRAEALARGNTTPIVEAREALALRRTYLAAEARVDDAERAAAAGRHAEAAKARDEASRLLDELVPPLSESRAVDELERRIEAVNL